MEGVCRVVVCFLDVKWGVSVYLRGGVWGVVGDGGCYSSGGGGSGGGCGWGREGVGRWGDSERGKARRLEHRRGVGLELCSVAPLRCRSEARRNVAVVERQTPEQFAEVSERNNLRACRGRHSTSRGKQAQRGTRSRRCERCAPERLRLGGLCLQAAASQRYGWD